MVCNLVLTRARLAAQAAGKFGAEIAPMELKGKKGPVTFDTDEHPKPGATVEKIGKLPTTFKKDLQS